MNLYEKNPAARSRWASFENPRGLKGQAAQENHGAKGHAFNALAPGETVPLMEAQGSGVVRRIWMTISDRSAKRLRELVLRMYWDGAAKPAVECPLGDFFQHALATFNAFESELFSSAEGRSFNCFVPMPFFSGARIELSNESDRAMSHLFYDVDYTLEPLDPARSLYFHAWWNRQIGGPLEEDLEILPKVRGCGRFLGMNVGVLVNPMYRGSWWGEGEVKVYLDGDDTLPTLAGTGVEDYIGSGWGQGRFIGRTQGCTEANGETGRYSFYRLHTVDPIWFAEDARVTLQTIGGAPASQLPAIRENARLTVVSADSAEGFRKLYVPGGDEPAPESLGPGDPWCNFYRKDDHAWTAYFYLDRPVSELPPIPAALARTACLD